MSDSFELISFLIFIIPADKPIIEDLQYFLEFQVPRQWAPVYNELPLGPSTKRVSCPSLQFSFMGPKLYVRTIQVSPLYLLIHLK
jgi:hypothetical protein